MKHTFLSFLITYMLVICNMAAFAQLPHETNYDSLWRSAIAKPYKWLHSPEDDAERDSITATFLETGKATFYSARMHGRMMSDGTRYDRNALFAAHRTLPFGTMVKVVNKKNGRETIVRIRDRGPFGKGLIIDLSNKAASDIGMTDDGIATVDLYVLTTDSSKKN